MTDVDDFGIIFNDLVNPFIVFLLLTLCFHGGCLKKGQLFLAFSSRARVPVWRIENLEA